MQNFKVSFYLRKDRPDACGLVPIAIMLHLNGRRLRLCNTGLNIRPKDWDSIKLCAKGRSGESQYINHRLQCLTAELTTIFHHNEFKDTLSLQLIKDIYLGNIARQDKRLTVLGFFDEYISKMEERVGVTVGKPTFGRYKFVRDLLSDFFQNKYRRKDMPLSELNYELVVGFEDYLRIDCHYDNQGTLNKKMQIFRTVIICAQKTGKLNIDPFYGYTIKSSDAARCFLTEEELQSLMDKELKIHRLELVRDLFVFSCFTGLAYSDVESLTEDNIVILDDVKWIIKPRTKTNVDSNIPILDIPQKILDKYKGLAPNGRLLPILSNQRLNSYLKELADICGIKKNLTFHVARHTFATLTLSKDVPLETVSKMMGHTKISTTQHYARITNKKIEKDMKILALKLMSFDGSKVVEAEANIEDSHSHRVKGNVSNRPNAVSEMNDDSVTSGKPSCRKAIKAKTIGKKIRNAEKTSETKAKKKNK